MKTFITTLLEITIHVPVFGSFRYWGCNLNQVIRSFYYKIKNDVVCSAF